MENGNIIVAEQYLSEYANYLEVKARMELREKEFKGALLKAMEDNGIKSYENDLMKVTYVAESTRKNIDSTALKEQAPSVYKAFLKESVVKPCLKITIK